MTAVVVSWASERCQFLVVAVLGPGQEAAEKEEKPARCRVSWGGRGCSSGLSRKLWELILESPRSPSSPTWGGDASQAVLWDGLLGFLVWLDQQEALEAGNGPRAGMACQGCRGLGSTLGTQQGIKIPVQFVSCSNTGYGILWTLSTRCLEVCWVKLYDV